MKKLTTQIIVITLSAFFMIACGDDKKEAKGGGPGGAPQGPQTFEVTKIPTMTVTGFTIYPTSIEGIVNSEVRAKISGYITEVLVDEGQQVRKGQTLFKLETQSLNQDAAAAKANVIAAQVEVDKLKPLVEKDIISNVQLETAKAELQQAQSSYSGIAANIDYGSIKSPVDGYVGQIRLRKGALVSPTSQQPLTTVSDISEVYAFFSMNEKEYLDFIQNAEGKDVEEKLKKLPKVSLILANGNTYEKEGTIETVNSQINANTGSISFRAVFDNSSRLLTNGSSGKIKIPKTYTDVLVVPKTSTYEQQGSTYVYKISKDTTAVSARIQIKDEVGAVFVISEGLEKGDEIIATGVAKVKGGSKIKPREVPFDSVAKPIEKVFK